MYYYKIEGRGVLSKKFLSSGKIEIKEEPTETGLIRTTSLENGGFRVAELRTWEPARDFTGNIYSSFPARGTAGRAFRKLLWLASLALAPIVQRSWWRLGRGGLIEVYAVKRT